MQLEGKELKVEEAPSTVATPVAAPRRPQRDRLHQPALRTKPGLLSFPWKPVFPDVPFLLNISQG